MEFIDKTGHIFSLDSYTEKPIGYEYDENPYIFWINETGKASANNYYVLPIRFILPSEVKLNNVTGIKIELDSTNFKLMGSTKLNELLNNAKNPFDYINIESEDLLRTELTEDDVVVVTNLENSKGDLYNMVTFYVVSTVTEESVFLTNILIQIGDYENGQLYPNYYCPITVGLESVEESETLIINGKNMGIDLPKDIIRAIYDSSFYNDVVDEELYNKKIKELLINYMNIKGECGNFKSAIDALKWFGWGKHVQISKLLQTDNEFINQYVLDYFDITNDTLKSFVYFRNATYVSLRLFGDIDTNESIPQKFDNDFWGEGHSKITSLVNSLKDVRYNEKDIAFYEPYYKFLFIELGLKLSALKYYYEKYFLPIHLKVHSISITSQVFMNDNKLLLGVNKAIITETPQLLYEKYNTKTEITFPKTNELILHQQRHYIDDNYNEFYDYIVNNAKYENSDIDLFYVNDTCLHIPILFNTKTYNSETKTWENLLAQYYDCIMLLEKVNKTSYHYKYVFEDKRFTYEDILNFILIESTNNTKLNDFHITYRIYENDKLVESSLESTLEELIYISTEEYYYNFNELKPTFEITFLTNTELSNIYIKEESIFSNVKLILLDDNRETVFETHFSFTQQGSMIYKDLVVVPKIFGRSNGIGFWINSLFKLHLSVNGEWFEYEFTPKMPDLYIELGKLDYKYFLDYFETDVITVANDVYHNIGEEMFGENKINKSKVKFDTDTNDNIVDLFEGHVYVTSILKQLIRDYNLNIDTVEYLLKGYKNPNTLNNGIPTPFNQLRQITDEKVYFNNFIWQPALVHVNNIDFFNDLLSAYKDLEIQKRNNTFFVEDFLTGDKQILTFNSEETPVYYAIKDDEKTYYVTKNDIINAFKYDNSIILTKNRIYWDHDNEISYYWHVSENHPSEYVYPSVTPSGTSTAKLYYYADNFKNDKCINVEIDSLGWNDNTKAYGIYTDKEKTNVIYFIFNKHTIEFFKFNTKKIGDITIITPVLLDTYKTIYTDINNILERYKEFPNIINNDKYLNRIHMFNITKNGNEFVWNASENESDIYRSFFNDNGECRVLIPNMGLNYDFYLMHDNTDWYGTFISKYTNDRMYIESKEISDFNKLFHYENIIGTIEVVDNGNIDDVDYRPINNEILRKLLLEQYGVRFSDLIITYNHTVFNPETGEVQPEMIDTHDISDPSELNNDTLYPAHKNYIITNIYVRGRYTVNNDTGIYFLETDGELDEQFFEEIQLIPELVILNWHTQDINYEYEEINGNYEYVCKCENVSNNFVRWNNESNYSYTSIYDLLNDVNYKVITDGNTTKHIYNKVDVYNFSHIKSDNKFLINRMQYSSSNGYNHFNADDLLVCTLTNNDRLEFKFDTDMKWVITPYTTKMDNPKIVNSSVEMPIISLGDGNIKYSNGYYNIQCSYSVDSVVENLTTKTTRFLIEKN